MLATVLFTAFFAVSSIPFAESTKPAEKPRLKAKSQVYFAVNPIINLSDNLSGKNFGKKRPLEVSKEQDEPPQSSSRSSQKEQDEPPQSSSLSSHKHTTTTEQLPLAKESHVANHNTTEAPGPAYLTESPYHHYHDEQQPPPLSIFHHSGESSSLSSYAGDREDELGVFLQSVSSFQPSFLKRLRSDATKSHYIPANSEEAQNSENERRIPVSSISSDTHAVFLSDRFSEPDNIFPVLFLTKATSVEEPPDLPKTYESQNSESVGLSLKHEKTVFPAGISKTSFQNGVVIADSYAFIPEERDQVPSQNVIKDDETPSLGAHSTQSQEPNAQLEHIYRVPHKKTFFSPFQFIPDKPIENPVRPKVTSEPTKTAFHKLSFVQTQSSEGNKQNLPGKTRVPSEDTESRSLFMKYDPSSDILLKSPKSKNLRVRKPLVSSPSSVSPLSNSSLPSLAKPSKSFLPKPAANPFATKTSTLKNLSPISLKGVEGRSSPSSRSSKFPANGGVSAPPKKASKSRSGDSKASKRQKVFSRLDKNPILATKERPIPKTSGVKHFSTVNFPAKNTNSESRHSKIDRSGAEGASRSKTPSVTESPVEKAPVYRTSTKSYRAPSSLYQVRGSVGKRITAPAQPDFVQTDSNIYVPNEYDEVSIPGVAGEDYPIYASIPETGFVCSAQSHPGLYTDQKTNCQVFHICQEGGRDDSFLCPNGTVFNQQYFVCDWWYNFSCDSAHRFYSLNSFLYELPDTSRNRS